MVFHSQITDKNRILRIFPLDALKSTKLYTRIRVLSLKNVGSKNFQSGDRKDWNTRRFLDNRLRKFLNIQAQNRPNLSDLCAKSTYKAKRFLTLYGIGELYVQVVLFN
jgi:hypothetical protein